MRRWYSGAMDLSKKMMLWNHRGCINFQRNVHNCDMLQAILLRRWLRKSSSSYRRRTSGSDIGHDWRVVEHESWEFPVGCLVYALAFFWYRIYRWFGEGWTSNIYRLYRAENLRILYTHILLEHIFYIHITQNPFDHLDFRHNIIWTFTFGR